MDNDRNEAQKQLVFSSQALSAAKSGINLRKDQQQAQKEEIIANKQQQKAIDEIKRLEIPPINLWNAVSDKKHFASSAVQSASRLVVLIHSSQKQLDSDNGLDELINTGYKAVQILLTSWKGDSALRICGYSDRIVRQGTYFCFRKLLSLISTKVHSQQSEFNLCLSTQFKYDLHLSSNATKIIQDDLYKTIVQYFSKDVPKLMVQIFIPTLTHILAKNSSTQIQQSQPSELHYSPTLQFTSNVKIQSCLLLGSLLREVANELKGSKAEQQQMSQQSSPYSIQNQASVFKQNIQDNNLLENTTGSNIDILDVGLETDVLQRQASLEHHRRQLLMNAIRAIIGLLNKDSKHVKASASRALGWL
ncbi:MAG: hypothetical protein EZS28_027684 [Streblomastix strix]|uniref:Uncharacterized protein n=1 Tax=Streblomastix strix TaxID=222440 RepID=A0A5J4V226_9EUKA|nr:MAG: hypothetical protein EZS28_027684 [Streblomastix strix]